MSIIDRIELTNEEFFFLASLFDCDALIGVPDPFIGYWIEDIEAAMKRAAQSLVKKGYIVYKDNDIDVIPKLFTYMEICTKTNMTLWMQSERNGKRDEIYYYFDAGKVIESHVFEIGEQLTYHLNERGTSIELWNEIVKGMLPKQRQVIQDGAIILDREEFIGYLENGKYSLKELEAKLRWHHASSNMAKQLAKSMKHHERYSQFTVFYRVEGDWRVNYIGLLCDEVSNFIVVGMEKHLRQFVKIYSIAQSEFIREMQGMILRSKSPSL
ncbi:hypothetical protein [Ectobacillus polymachus]|uniref:hypothetical protein n=1 Tax=Ectobacillus polymachus TaxID=1508806 RepID=UPI003A83A0D1